MKKRLTALFLCLVMCLLSVITFSGCKEKTFTVTFERGGTKGMNITVMEGYENIPEIQTVSHWSEIDFPVYICDGHTFSDWNQVISRIDKDTVITAQWTPYPFIVKFNSINPEATLVSAALLEQTIHNWSEVIWPTFELPGYTLKWEGWDVRNTKDTTVVAKWIPNKYTLSFVDENGVSYDFDSVEVTYDAPVGILPTPEKDNKFGGWYVKGNVSDYVIEGANWKRLEDTTLVSRWLEDDQYRIVYKNAYDIKGEVSYRSTDEDFVINPPSRYGYDFLGWTGTGIGDTPQTEVIIKSGTEGDLEFTAHWRAKTRSLILDGDGGRVNQNSWTVTFGEKVGALPKNVLKDGYEFVGWETENGAMINSDTVWSWDPDKTTFIKAVYKRLYTVKLMLKCPSSKVICSLSGAIESELEIEKSQTEDNVWVFKKTFKEGDRIGTLPDKNAVSFENGDYSFSHWATNTGSKVNASDIVNEKKFPGTRESGVIYIYVKLSYNWTPFY